MVVRDMARRLAVVAALAATLACAAPASAQDGGGLYEPFPEPAARERALRFAARLGVAATEADLRRGRFLPGSTRAALALAPAPPAGPSARAGEGTALGGGWGLAAAAGLLVAGAAGARRLGAP